MTYPTYEIGIATIQNARNSNQDNGLAFTYDASRIHIKSTVRNLDGQAHFQTELPHHITGAILCDGLHPNGDEASEKMITLFADIIEYQTRSHNTPIERFNLRYFSRIQEIVQGATTALLCTIDQNGKLDIGYIGDTRAYYASANDEILHLLSRDHTYQRQSLEKNRGIEGILSAKTFDFWDDPEQVEYIQLAARRVRATSRLTKSLGYLMRQELETTIYEVSPPIQIKLNDTIALLTDGAYDAFRNQRNKLNDLLRSNNPQKAANQLMKVAEEWTDDNATAIIIKRTS